MIQKIEIENALQTFINSFQGFTNYPVVQFEDGKYFTFENIEGYIGRKNNALYVGFQGSSTATDVLMDLNFFKRDFENTTVHAGFLTAYKKVFDFVYKQAMYNNTVIFTGQSLGSAISQLFAYKIKYDFSHKNVKFIGFATPRVGGLDFKNKFEKILKDESLNFCNANDIVPVIPPKIFNYFDSCEKVILGENKKCTYVLNEHLPLQYIENTKKWLENYKI